MTLLVLAIAVAASVPLFMTLRVLLATVAAALPQSLLRVPAHDAETALTADPDVFHPKSLDQDRTLCHIPTANSEVPVGTTAHVRPLPKSATLCRPINVRASSKPQ